MLVVFIFLLVCSASLRAQSEEYSLEYLDKSSRFAWLTLGGDLNILTGGSSSFQSAGTLQEFNWSHTLTPRLTIGGIHFWGHADFYVTFPLSFLTWQDRPAVMGDLSVQQGVETGARLYPWKLESGKLRPFAGISFRRFVFSQEQEGSPYTNGAPRFGRFIYPWQFGLSYTTKKWIFSASSYYQRLDRFDYYLSPTQQARVNLQPWSLNFSILRHIDSDARVRSKRAHQAINQEFNRLKEAGKLSAWFVGLGPSAALQMGRSSYLEQNYPYLAEDNATSVFPEVSAGRYFYKGDFNLNLAYRNYGYRYQGYDQEIATHRHSLGVEGTKYLFNYLGFAPYVGPILSYEWLKAEINGTNYRDQQWRWGITFGWDIRVIQTGNSLLRTNLRYYPQLDLDLDGGSFAFNHLEFNFIQYIYFFGRN